MTNMCIAHVGHSDYGKTPLKSRKIRALTWSLRVEGGLGMYIWDVRIISTCQRSATTRAEARPDGSETRLRGLKAPGLAWDEPTY